MLDVGFNNKVQDLFDICRNDGVEIQRTEAVRDPFKQAKYWRRGRSTDFIQGMINRLEKDSLYFLAHCIESVGPQHGDLITHAIPGHSWHQYGFAVDVLLYENGKPIWNDKAPYEYVARQAKKLGITSGYFWTFQDVFHLQYLSHSVINCFAEEDINFMMEARYADS